MPQFDEIFGQDSKKAVDGVWVDHSEGLKLLIARQGNAEYTKLMRRLSKPHLRRLKRDIPLDLMEGLMKQAMAKTILLGWKGLEEKGEDGVSRSIPYSQEKALELLKKSQDFYEDVLEISGERELFRIEMKEETEKNSEASSNGS